MNLLKRAFPAFLLLSSCSSSASLLAPSQAPDQQQPVEPHFELSGQTFSTQGLLDQLLVTLQHAFPQGNFSHIDWRNLLRWPGLLRRTDLLITDVKLADTGQSLMNTSSGASIEPDYAGKSFHLTLTGKFEENRKALPQAGFAFALTPPLFLTSVSPEKNEPPSRLVLDDAVLLSVESVTATEIQATLETRAIPDLYLAGWHKLTLIHGNYYTDALIRVGKPVPLANALQPSVTSIEVVRNERHEPRYLKVKGQNLMIQPLFSYSTVDQVFVFSDRTSVSEKDGQTEWETLTLIPDPKTFDRLAQHTLAYATPFGTVLKNF